ncbi:tRNA (adenosine(37)-N6)-dimethylallyltransferase MiaA [soil metagenome]
MVGATGTGKSALSLDLAEFLATADRAVEIVNADAMQLYRGMDVGTAKLPEGERRGIRHHLLDVLQPSEEASVARYQLEARAVIDDIISRGALPILVGGSGLYVSSVIFDFRFPGTDAAIRARLETELVERGPGLLFRRLAELDPAAAESIGPTNGRRIVRALEVIELTGEPFGAGLPDEGSTWRPTTIIGLQSERQQLVLRLDERVRQMWRDGILDEVAVIGGANMGVTASRAIGYAQALAQLAGTLTEAQAIEQSAGLTRRYARRQVGWFRRYPNTLWLHADDPQRLAAAMARLAG